MKFFCQLLRFICELHAKKICEQPQEFLVSILAVIELGLTLFGPDITTLCCEFIQTFSKYLCQNSTTAQLPPEKFLLLQPFLKVSCRVEYTPDPDVVPNTFNSFSVCNSAYRS